MNWDDLRFVLALSRHRSHNRAAAHLKATHTTVARRLRALEAALGTRLFDRTPDGYVPTSTGHEVALAAERVEAELLGLEARVLGGDARLQGKLRVTTMDIFVRRYHAAFRTFTERNPGVELTLTCTDQEASLTRREADVALRMTNRPPDNLVGRKVGRVEFAVYGQRELVRRLERSRSGLGALPWLHWDERLDPRWLDAWLGLRAPGAKVALRVDAPSLALRELVAAGIGVHFLATFEGDTDPRLARIGRVEHDFSRELWLLTLPELRGTTRVRAFLDHMEQALRRDARGAR
ncbi:MAG: LysR family transcriptional regulator [Myxococcaceae bacterium]|nr:LysR family transcriptional regulator [Myxococcaceae bacterium]